MEYIELLIERFIELGGSDLHLSVGKRPMMRNHSILEGMEEFDKVVTSEDMEVFISKYQSDKIDDWIKLKGKQINSIDSALSFNDRRFRLHLYRSSSGVVLVFRILQEKIPTIDALNLPNEIRSLENFKRGLILVTGATGSGKSTTLAAILNEINQKKSKVIVTVEDPIEYVYRENMCRIEQREVGLHVDSFGSATRDMMREDPDIILVGEMRDPDTIKNAITLSETGHLVFSTLHTKSVSDTIDRMVDVFPAEQQQQIRIQLSFVLIGIVNQTLIKSNSDGVIPLCELMMNDSVTSSMIRQAKSGSGLKDYMRSSKNGSVHIVDNAAWHIMNGRMEYDQCKEILDSGDMNILKAVLEENGMQTDKVRMGSLAGAVNKGIGVRSVGKRRF